MNDFKLIAGLWIAGVLGLFTARAQILTPILFANTTITPPPLSGMLLWWSADVGANCSGVACTNGGTQNSWADQSGNGNTGTLTPSISSPCVGSVFNTSQINGKPAVTFNGNTTAGSETCFSVGNSGVGLNNKSATSMFVVEKLASTAVVNTLASGGSGAIQWASTTSKEQQGVKACVSILGTGTGASDTSWHQLNLTYDGTNIFLRKDRSADGNAAPAVAITSNWLTLGVNLCGGGIQTMDGQIAEFILYNRVLSGGEITTVETYLNSKYGL